MSGKVFPRTSPSRDKPTGICFRTSRRIQASIQMVGARRYESRLNNSLYGQTDRDPARVTAGGLLGPDYFLSSRVLPCLRDLSRLRGRKPKSTRGCLMGWIVAAFLLGGILGCNFGLKAGFASGLKHGTTRKRSPQPGPRRRRRTRRPNFINPNRPLHVVRKRELY